MILLACLASIALKTNTVTITVDPSVVISHPSRYLTGACIEDVNHELYGGIYSQMVFGESFAEPAAGQQIKGFLSYGGAWHAEDGILRAGSGDGPKLIWEGLQLDRGSVEAEIRSLQTNGGFPGIIFHVCDPKPGADAFFGYEVSLDIKNKQVIVGKHLNNWKLLGTYPCKIINEEWQKLQISIDGPEFEVLVNGSTVAKIADSEDGLMRGFIGLRPWQCDAEYRNLAVNGQKVLFANVEKDSMREVSGMWDPVVSSSARSSFELMNDSSGRLPQVQKITFVSGKGEVGIANKGLNRRGMGFVAGKPYEGVVWALCDKGTDIWFSLESADGKTRHAETSMQAKMSGWNRIAYRLSPKNNEKNGRLTISLRKPGEVSFGYVSLEPGPWGRFKGLPVRKDVAEGLIKQGLTVLRMGGCMVNCPEYRWKNMIGPRDERPGYRGFWYPHSSNGWGIIEFIKFCRAAGFLCIPDFYIGETEKDMADFVEYVNGSADTTWGKKRVEDGQKEPFKLKYIQLGNEEQLNDEYWSKFKALAETIWSKDPSITIVVGDFAYNKVIEDPYNFEGGAGAKSLAVQKKIVELAHAKGGKVAFDLHIWNDDPNQPDLEDCGLPGARSFISQLKKLCPGLPFKVFIFEENANNHEMRRALGHAHAINEITRIADDVPILCAANCLQPDKQNDNGWNQGLLFLSPNSVWAQPPYYVTQMVSRNYLPLCVKASFDGPQDALDVTATRSEDGKILQIAVVNILDKPQAAIIDFPKYSPSSGKYRVEWIEGGLNEKNTEENPFHAVSKKTTKTLKLKEGMLGHTFPAHSFTIIRLGV